MAEVFDRKKDALYREDQLGLGGLNFLYNSVVGRLCLKVLLRRSFSKLGKIYNSSKFSARKIPGFIKRYNIDMGDYQSEQYPSFQAFFTRKVTESARKTDQAENALVAAADAKLLVHKIGDDLTTELGLKAKGSCYTVSELIGDAELAQEFRNGLALVFRLTPDDYHRYIFFDGGKLTQSKEIDGILHTVTPIATSKYKVFSQNYRIVSVLDTQNFKKAVQIEVGALMVGKVHNLSLENAAQKFVRGQEKGYFEFGASTIILLLQENCAVIDDDIIAHSAKGVEVKVRLGEKIGRKPPTLN
jgi:phosphatidylserine decarboxylase